MATWKPSFASSADFTCALASKTSGQGRRSAAVDNSANLYADALVFVSCTPGTITAPAIFNIFGYGSHDGSNFDTGGSSDADYNTLAGDEKLIGQVAILANATARGGVFYFTSNQYWVGGLPRNWGIIVSQTNCGTFSATEGNHLKKYAGISYTIA